jgi:hypothetical protein
MTEDHPESQPPKKNIEVEKSVEREFANNPASITRELVKLIKKEKLANDILEREFKESV